MKTKNFACQMTLGKFLLVIGLMLFVSVAAINTATAQSAQIIYVRKGAASPGDGGSWATAYPDLQQAIATAASLSGSKEIWVAQGEYKPTPTLDKSVSFILPTNTVLYGGFLGNETSSATRNWKVNRTVLSGDLGIQFDKSDNSYNVVKATDVDQNTKIDGFIIKEGNTAELGYPGAGIFINGATVPTSPQIKNCEFVGHVSATGGALASQGNASPEVIGCIFTGNHASVGGAVFIGGAPSTVATFVNCVFSSNTSEYLGGAIGTFRSSSFINCTITNNTSDGGGPAIVNGAHVVVRNSIIWKNFEEMETPNYQNQIDNIGGGTTFTITDNIIQGGFGTVTDNNIDADPLFEKEAALTGVYPRTSILPVSTTDAKYENTLSFNGPKMTGPWPYYAYKDHQYNKLYLSGRNLQVIDFSTLTNNQPTSTLYGQVLFGRTQRLEKSVHTNSNRIYFASYFSGVVSLDRVTGQLTDHTPLAGEPITYNYAKARDLVVDDANNLLYTPIFYEPGNVFYGILELNLTTQAKRWITQTSSPVAISTQVSNLDEDAYWGGYRIYLDEAENTFYFSTGNGVWWWNRTTNNTGVINTTGGLTLEPGNPALPSNLTTGIFIDHVENKFYIGTHAGLFVWNRNNNTSRIYNTSNSILAHNLINMIDKNEEQHLVYVACEEGGLFVINSLTGEEKLITQDQGSEVYPQYMDASAASAYYDEVDKKLYVSADHTGGGVWIQDYNNLIPDYGDLRIRAGSPAIDKANSAFYPAALTTDIGGLIRFSNYPTIEGDNGLDIGAHERPYNAEEEESSPPLEISDRNYILTFSPMVEIVNEPSLENSPIRQVNKNITYFDGLGRPVQSIAIQGSPQRNDIVTPIIYDPFGREPVRYLPYSSGNNGSYKTSPVESVQTFYNQNNAFKIATDSRPFSETVFEPSPLNRPIKDYGPGSDWKNNEKFVQHSYLSNVAADENIIAWKMLEDDLLDKESDVEGYIENSYYLSGQLYIKVTIDEHGNAVREYTNKEGQVILKKVQVIVESTDLNNLDEWASTYYIYDDLGNLRLVIPPAGVKYLLTLEE